MEYAQWRNVVFGHSQLLPSSLRLRVSARERDLSERAQRRGDAEKRGQNKKPDYIEKFMQHIDWTEADRRYRATA